MEKKLIVESSHGEKAHMEKSSQWKAHMEKKTHSREKLTEEKVHSREKLTEEKGSHGAAYRERLKGLMREKLTRNKSSQERKAQRGNKLIRKKSS